MGTGSFPGVKSGRGMKLTPHSLLVPWSRKSRAIPLLPLWAVQPVLSLSACTRVHFIFFLRVAAVFRRPFLQKQETTDIPTNISISSAEEDIEISHHTAPWSVMANSQQLEAPST